MPATPMTEAPGPTFTTGGTVVVPAAYTTYQPYPVYVRPSYYYPPVSLSLGYVWHGGGHRGWR